MGKEDVTSDLPAMATNVQSGVAEVAGLWKLQGCGEAAGYIAP